MIKSFSIGLLASLSFNVLANNAYNDVYGIVSEVHLRSSQQGEDVVYFRVKEDGNYSKYSQYASCISDPKSMVFSIDLTKVVGTLQYQEVLNSYRQGNILRLIGQDTLCQNGETNSDQLFELSPLN